ncbi:MAG TPA: DMT family transporter [Polyangia bacterium]|nr:DMT family transporter [Polyangia bacterium]
MEPVPESPAAAPEPVGPALYAAAALVGFAANSLLCRAALGAHRIDAASFTSIRLGTGALMLSLLAWRDPTLRARKDRTAAGSWRSAAALFAYAAAFSFAYLRLSAGAGALILFAAVQATMIGWGLAVGHERPRLREWLGMIVALTGIAVLAAPGLSAHDPIGIGLMVLAGMAWGLYSLRGRKAAHPLATTAANFVRGAPLALLMSLLFWSRAHASPGGMALAAASGGVASGIGYSLWYAALRHISATRAAIVQLSVPVVAAVGGIVLLGEPLTLRLAVAALAIVAGVGMALSRR